MELHITNNQGIFEINGFLNIQNIDSIKGHFETLIEETKTIVISLDRIKDIDTVAIKYLASLYKTAIRKNKAFYIIGSENKKVRDLFKEQKMFYVLRRDNF